MLQEDADVLPAMISRFDYIRKLSLEAAACYLKMNMADYMLRSVSAMEVWLKGQVHPETGETAEGRHGRN